MSPPSSHSVRLAPCTPPTAGRPARDGSSAAGTFVPDDIRDPPIPAGPVGYISAAAPAGTIVPRPAPHRPLRAPDDTPRAGRPSRPGPPRVVASDGASPPGGASEKSGCATEGMIARAAMPGSPGTERGSNHPNTRRTVMPDLINLTNKDLDREYNLEGYDAYDADGDKLGDITGVIAEGEAMTPRYVVVDAGGWFSTKEFVVPIGDVREINDD